ncbi:MAG: GNAT family N-acetyltransferase [Anaerolineales bacterium]|nr:GNAT family N-acetyltransferase [Anaerolineales bacterium]MBX3038542.1 GNAT family N-acetyltransferase [Anaerolineales bacterium]
MSNFHIREFSFDGDYERVLNLWKEIEIGMNVGKSDSPEEIKKKIQRDPDLFLIAESNHQIIGTVIGAFDGRRGFIYHLAVHKKFRRQKVASQLLSNVEERLKNKGCLKCLLMVFADNTDAIHFYNNHGWHHQPEDLVFAKEF